MSEITEDFFAKYNKIQRYSNYEDVLKLGQEVFVAEKVHGSNVRFMYTKEKGFQRGTKNALVGTVDPNTVTRAIDLVCTKYAIEAVCRAFPNWIIYGEVFGPGIQKGYDYGRTEADFLIFDAFDTTNPRWLPPQNLLVLSNVGGFRVAPGKYSGPWDPEVVLPLASAQSILHEGTPSEGIVIRRRPEAKADFGGAHQRVIFKHHNPAFLKKKEKANEPV